MSSEPGAPSAPDPEATLFARPAARKAFARPALQSDAAARSAEEKNLQLDALTGLNPLVATANPLLALVPQLRNTVSYPDPAGLRETLLRQIGAFEKAARDQGVQPDVVTMARYVLATLIDEAISYTPWGGSGQWARSSLLVTLFNEAWGGEKIFLLLGKLAEDPQRNLHMLELLYVCLTLGFEGRYRAMDGGKAQLEDVRERLYQMIRKQRGAAETGLSPHWQGVHAAVGRGVRLLPLWVTVAVATLVLATVFIYLNFALNERSDEAGRLLAAMKVPVVSLPKSTAPAVEPMRLKKALASDIAAGQVGVEEDERTSLVSIRGDNIFDKGNAQIADAYGPVVDRITDALNSVPGTVVVRGHTDSTPIHTVRFPSNWHLSQERAVSVAKLISAKINDPKRVKAEGMADGNPVAPNDTAENRARNRRVEILLRVQTE